MAGLLDKIKSLPQGNRIFLDGDMNEGDDTGDMAHEETHKSDPVQEPAVEKPVEKPEEKTAPAEDVEPAKNASKAEKEAYKARRVKAADEEASRVKAENEQLKKERDDARKEREDWKKQAETVAQRREQPRAEAVAKPVELPDITKDPVGHLSQRLEQSEQKYQALEAMNTNDRALRELEMLESAYSKKNPDHAEVMKFGEEESIKRNLLLNPNANEAQLRANFKASKLDTVVKLMIGGMSEEAAVARVHDMTKVIFGWQPKAAVVPEPVVDDKSAAEKAKFAAVTKNKAKAATGLTAGGSASTEGAEGNARTNPKSLKEIAKMTKAQRDAYYSEK